MKKISMAVLLSLASITGIAMAQSGPTGEVRESTDPAKIAAIEQHARELASGTQQNAQSDTDRPNRHGRKNMAGAHRQHDMSSGAGRSGDSSTGRPAER